MKYQTNCLNKKQIDEKLDNNKREASISYIKQLIYMAIFLIIILITIDFQTWKHVILIYIAYAILQGYNCSSYRVKMDNLKKFIYILSLFLSI